MSSQSLAGTSAFFKTDINHSHLPVVALDACSQVTNGSGAGLKCASPIPDSENVDERMPDGSPVGNSAPHSRSNNPVSETGSKDGRKSTSPSGGRSLPQGRSVEIQTTSEVDCTDMSAKDMVRFAEQVVEESHAVCADLFFKLDYAKVTKPKMVEIERLVNQLQTMVTRSSSIIHLMYGKTSIVRAGLSEDNGDGGEARKAKRKRKSRGGRKSLADISTLGDESSALPTEPPVLTPADTERPGDPEVVPPESVDQVLGSSKSAEKDWETVRRRKKRRPKRRGPQDGGVKPSDTAEGVGAGSKPTCKWFKIEENTLDNAQSK